MTTLPGDADSRDGARIYNQVLDLEKQLKRARGLDVRNVRTRLRNKYVEVLIKDTKFAEERNVANVLWQNMFYLPITELKNRIAASQTEVQKLKNFLAEGIQFYDGLIRKVKKKYGLSQETLDIKGPDFDLLAQDANQCAECTKTCHRLFVHLGDLCRYKEQYPESTTNFAVPASYYYKAIALYPSAGHPHNQLAVLATYMHNDFVAVYHYFRSLAVREPSDTAKANMSILFQKNRQQYDELTKRTGNEEDNLKLELESSTTKLKKAFCVSFVRLCGIVYLKSVDEFSDVYHLTTQYLEDLLSLDLRTLEKLFKWDLQNPSIPPTCFGLASVQVVCMLICSVPNNTYAGAVQASSVSRVALTAAFKFAACFMAACMKSADASASPMLAGSLVFVEWLASRPEISTTGDDDRLSSTKALFWKEFVALLNSLCNERNGGSSNEGPTIALWEDHELRGFAPLATVHSRLNFNKEYMNKEEEVQGLVRRFIAAGKALVGRGKGLVFDEDTGKFFLAGEPVPAEPVIPLAAEVQEDEEELIVFQPAAKVAGSADVVQNQPYEAFRSPLIAPRVASPLPQQAVSGTTFFAGSLEPASTLEPVPTNGPFNIPPPVEAAPLATPLSFQSSLAMADGLGALPTSTVAAFGGLQHPGYGYSGGELLKDASPISLPFPSPLIGDTVASLNNAYSSSLAQDLLYKLQNASLMDKLEGGLFPRQASNAGVQAQAPVADYFKPPPASNDVVKEDSSVMRASVRPPPGFGPVPARAAANKQVQQPRVDSVVREDYKLPNKSNWIDNYPAAPRPLFGADFGGIWSNGTGNGLQSPAASYPFPGMAVRTVQHAEQQQPQALQFQQQPEQSSLQQPAHYYGGWKQSENPILGYDAQQLQQQEQQILQQNILRQYRPPDPFVS